MIEIYEVATSVGQSIIFVNTRVGTSELAQSLTDEGMSIYIYTWKYIH